MLASQKIALSSNKFIRSMATLVPPSIVKNMTTLDRSAFSRNIELYTVSIPIEACHKFIPKMKKYVLRLPKFSNAIECSDGKRKEILLNPDVVHSQEEAASIALKCDPEVKATSSKKEVCITYDNWSKDHIIEAVLPDGISGFSGFSQIGHIVHLNLRENLGPFKHVLAQVLIDKLPTVRLVVNKTNIIDDSDNEFRSFSMETLAGDGDMIASVAENGCIFALDFSKVYWNTRLGTEHTRIKDKVQRGDILFDVMAGIGPFSVPCAKKRCTVFANDLNPVSHEYLVKNSIKNKTTEYLTAYNMDGNEFIHTVVKEELLNAYADPDFHGDIHVTMNLPSIAVTFLPSFIGLLRGHIQSSDQKLPIIHVYMFNHNSTKEFAVLCVASQLGYCKKAREMTKEEQQSLSLDEINDNIDSSFLQFVREVIHVRKVSPNKSMMRVSFQMPSEVLTPIDKDTEEPPTKKFKAVS